MLQLVVYAFSPVNMGAHPGPNNPSKNTIYSAAVKGGYDVGSYSSQAGSSGILMTVEKTGSDSSSRSQLQDSDVDSVGSGSLAYGTVGNAVEIGMSGYDASASTDVQGSEVISSSSVLMPLQQSSYSSNPVLLTVEVQTGPQSNSQQPASSGYMAQSSRLQLTQSSDQQLPQPSSQSAVHASRLPHKPHKPHQSGSRPVQNPILNSSMPLKPKKESASHPSLQILQYGNVPSSLAVASYELVSQSSGQAVTQPSDVQPPHIIDFSAVQPSSQVVQQAVDTSVAQASSQQLVQSSQSVSQSNDQQPLHGSYVFTAQPSGLTFLKPHKSRPQFGSKPPSSTSLHTPSLNFVAQSTSQIPVQTRNQFRPQPALQLPVQASYQSEAQSAFQMPGQTGYLSVPQIVKPAQFGYQSASQALVSKPVHPIYQSVAQPTAPQVGYQSVSQSNGKQLVQASYQLEAQPETISYRFVAEPSVQQPAEVSFSIAPPAPQPVQPNYQWVAQLGLHQPAHVGFFVAQPISQQAGQSTYEYVVERSGQPLFKPAHSHGLHQTGSKLYSCQELPQHGYQRRFQSPSSFLALDRHTKPVVQSSNQTPAKPNHHRPHTSTLQSILTPAHLLSSHQSLSRPVYMPQALVVKPVFTPQALPVEPMYQPVAQSSSESVSFAEYQISPVPGQIVSQPQMQPGSLSLTQSSSSSGMPLQSSFQPLVQSSYETVLQPGFQTTSELVPSSHQSTSSQALSGPEVSNHESVFQPVQPEFAIPQQVENKLVTGQNNPGHAQNGHSSQKLFRLLQQVKS
ncbi:uncharacterized protein isoform X2 [Danio rerio]|uniref:Uncharacterized protein isoform X2 n=1 Tax=Danio rerio TaxID=7955 RepID=A0AC58GT78_DANRE